MPIIEVVKFIFRRLGHDSPNAFVCRLLRFGFLLLFMPKRWKKAKAFHKETKRYKIADVLDFKMVLDTQDSGISTDLYCDGFREPLITDYLRRVVKPKQFILDIGANIGYYAVQESKLVGPDGVVWAVEPVQKNIELLDVNLKLNGCNNVWVWGGAVGDKNCETEINISPMRNMGTLKRKENFRKYSSMQKVEVKTLDTLLMNRLIPDIIRMDVEGYELEILRGGSQTLKNGHAKLFIEVHFDVLRFETRELVELLKNYGYDIEVATFEPHYSTRDVPWARNVTRWLDNQIGAESSYLTLKIDDFLSRRFVDGQVEDLEVVFSKRK